MAKEFWEDPGKTGAFSKDLLLPPLYILYGEIGTGSKARVAVFCLV